MCSVRGPRKAWPPDPVTGTSDPEQLHTGSSGQATRNCAFCPCFFNFMRLQLQLQLELQLRHCVLLLRLKLQLVIHLNLQLLIHVKLELLHQDILNLHLMP